MKSNSSIQKKKGKTRIKDRKNSKCILLSALYYRKITKCLSGYKKGSKHNASPSMDESSNCSKYHLGHFILRTWISLRLKYYRRHFYFWKQVKLKKGGTFLKAKAVWQSALTREIRFLIFIQFYLISQDQPCIKTEISNLLPVKKACIYSSSASLKSSRKMLASKQTKKQKTNNNKKTHTH